MYFLNKFDCGQNPCLKSCQDRTVLESYKKLNSTFGDFSHHNNKMVFASSFQANLCPSLQKWEVYAWWNDLPIDFQRKIYTVKKSENQKKKASLSFQLLIFLNFLLNNFFEKIRLINGIWYKIMKWFGW